MELQSPSKVHASLGKASNGGISHGVVFRRSLSESPFFRNSVLSLQNQTRGGLDSLDISSCTEEITLSSDDRTKDVLPLVDDLDQRRETLTKNKKRLAMISMGLNRISTNNSGCDKAFFFFGRHTGGNRCTRAGELPVRGAGRGAELEAHK